MQSSFEVVKVREHVTLFGVVFENALINKGLVRRIHVWITIVSVKRPL